jgi:hypothetical protein
MPEPTVTVRMEEDTEVAISLSAPVFPHACFCQQDVSPLFHRLFHDPVNRRARFEIFPFPAGEALIR